MTHTDNEQIRTLTERCERLESELRRRDRDTIAREVQERELEQQRRTALAEAEAARLHDEEVEGTRQSAWFLALTDPSDAENFRRIVEEDKLDPARIRARIPTDGSWPPGDGPQNHSFVHPAPTGGIVPALSGDDEPELVKQARARGIKF